MIPLSDSANKGPNTSTAVVSGKASKKNTPLNQSLNHHPTTGAERVSFQHIKISNANLFETKASDPPAETFFSPMSSNKNVKLEVTSANTAAQTAA